MKLQNLKKLRETHSLTQKQLAEQLGLKSGKSIYNYENGLREPSIKELVKISEIFNCTIDYLIKGGDDNAWKET